LSVSSSTSFAGGDRVAFLLEPSRDTRVHDRLADFETVMLVGIDLNFHVKRVRNQLSLVPRMPRADLPPGSSCADEPGRRRAAISQPFERRADNTRPCSPASDPENLL
jgi:hypothetical protein